MTCAYMSFYFNTGESDAEMEEAESSETATVQHEIPQIQAAVNVDIQHIILNILYPMKRHCKS